MPAVCPTVPVLPERPAFAPAELVLQRPLLPRRQRDRRVGGRRRLGGRLGLGLGVMPGLVLRVAGDVADAAELPVVVDGVLVGRAGDGDGYLRTDGERPRASGG